MIEDYLTAKELQTLLKYKSIVSVYRLKKQIGFVKRNKELLFKHSDVQIYISKKYEPSRKVG